MESINKGIEEKKAQLLKEAQNQMNGLAQIESAIKKLKHDKKVIQENLNKIDGAIQAYSESLRSLNGEVVLASNDAEPNGAAQG